MRDAESGIRDSWERLGKPIFALACAYCRKMFRLFLPEIETVSVYELLAKSSEFQIPDSEFHIFNPCASRDYPEMREAVETLMGASKNLADKARRSEKSRVYSTADSFKCCGYGGHIRLANRDLYDEIVENRVRECELPYVVYCANCWEIFTLQGKECRHILDLLFDINSGLPSLDEKKENARRLAMAHGQPPIAKNPWDDLELIVGEDLRPGLRDKFIEFNDIRETIYKAEHDGGWFCRESDNVRQAALEHKVITFWVQYKIHDSEPGIRSYEVVSAFTHAMKYER
jgi:hypothetical protein